MDDLDQLLARIADGSSSGDAAEDRYVEFKTDGRSLADDLSNLAEAATCMANTVGGVIVVGIRDRDSGPAAVIGTQLHPE